MTDRIDVLIIDDNADLADNLQEILEDEGFDCTVIYSGSDALTLLERHRYDVVLTDLRMEGVDGVCVTETVRRVSPTTPVVLMTAYASDAMVQTARNAGAKHVMFKPIDVGGLVDLVGSLTSSNTRVLLVEDDADLRENLAEAVESFEGVTVRAAPTIATGLRQALSQEFDVAVLDIRLPDGNGVELATQLRERLGSKCPSLVYISAFVDDIPSPPATEGPQPQVLRKPFSPTALVSVLRRVSRTRTAPPDPIAPA